MVAENTKRIISERGLKQKHVASEAGYKYKTFSNLLNGRKTITDEDILKIAKALGVTPNDLYGIC